jgi:chromosomal replication initiation ATPase DnaA
MTPARIEAPDDDLMQALLVKLLADRQLTARPALVRYIVPRIERSFAAVQAVVARLDAEALARGAELDLPLARAVLAEAPDAD